MYRVVGTLLLSIAIPLGVYSNSLEVSQYHTKDIWFNKELRPLIRKRAGDIKSIVTMHPLPSAPFTIEIYRPLVTKSREYPLATMEVNEETIQFLQGDTPKNMLLLLGSGAYLPGERIEVAVVNGEGDEIDRIDFIPHPFTRVDHKGHITVNFELIHLKDPTTYRVTYTSVCPYESLRLVARLGEKQRRFLLGTPCTMEYNPGWLGIEGGVTQLTVRRSNCTEEMKIALPWGTYLRTEIDGGPQRTDYQPVHCDACGKYPRYF